MLILQFDGLYRPISSDAEQSERGGAGFLCYGWVILRNEDHIARGHGGYVRGKEASSNVAEYLALVEGLEALLDLGAQRTEILIQGDAQSVIEQMQGAAVVNSASIKPLYRRAEKLARRFHHIDWLWAPRRFNREADALTRRALRQLRDNPDAYAPVIEGLTARACRGRASNALLPLLNLSTFLA